MGASGPPLALPDGNHGDNLGMNSMPPPTAAQAETENRQRLSLDLAPGVAVLLDHVSTVTGVPKSQVAMQALLEALPALLERAESIQKRHSAVAQALRQGQSHGINKVKR